MSKKVRVRFAPSPTGPLHIGGVRTALFNLLFARKHGGDFILRIEDTDSKREVAGSVNYILKSFEWLGIKVDESPDNGGDYGPYTQSMRREIYREHVDKLLESGHAYYAFDTAEELSKMREGLKAAGVNSPKYGGVIREKMKNSLHMSSVDVQAKIDAGDPYVIRYNMPRNKDVKFHDEVRGWVTINTKDLDDKVLWKSSDGLPTYHLANVVDDHLMEISHVIRGEEWISSTPLHVLLYNALGWDIPVFAHLPLILDKFGKKLGKRNKQGTPVFPLDWTYLSTDEEYVDIKGFKEAGYESDALINFLALLGWNPGNNIEFMTMDEMVSSFSLDRINPSGAMFDEVKLNSFNEHYLRSRDKDWILEHMTNMPEEFLFDPIIDSDKLDLIANMAVERVTFANELKGALNYLFERPSLDGELKLKNVDEFEKVMDVFAADDFMSEFEESEWTPKNIRHELDTIAASIEIKLGKIMPMLRLALTGGEPGPQLPDIMYVLGSKETKDRIDILLKKIKEIA